MKLRMVQNIDQNTGDYILSFVVVVQSFLVVFQQCLIAVLQMPPESTTIYRVFLSAVSVLLAFPYIWLRRKILFVGTYTITILILLIHSTIFSDNIPYIQESVFRFLLPILLPTFLAVTCIRKFQILIDTLYYVSWATFFLALIYVLFFLNGKIVFESYNMGFSYGLLLPVLSLYTRKCFWATISSILLFFIIIALGSRGAAVIIIIFWLYDIFINNKKLFILFALFVYIVYLLLPFFIDMLSDVGITSRTLSLLLAGDINNDSGRLNIYQNAIRELMNAPIMGLGVFGDRVFFNGSYCHNFFLELMVDFGIPLAFLFIMGLIVWTITRYFQFKPCNRFFLIIVVLVTAKLFVSGSYLEDYDFAFLCGVLYRGDKDILC